VIIIQREAVYSMVKGEMRAHLAINFPVLEWGPNRTLCGLDVTTATATATTTTTTTTTAAALTNSASKHTLSTEHEVTMVSVIEILRAVANDDKDRLCNKCLAEFFDNVLPLKWKAAKKEMEETKEEQGSKRQGEKEKEKVGEGHEHGHTSKKEKKKKE
jgi:hypothetical protein